ncbi:TonB-dependent receptor domain-containing protein [Gibbsiella quercinecans]|uniref:TonB-dependent receptor domain-containing protein n=1 Tax=Gibbsiella quercinecans TaxID=929813 RepID=UPI00243036BF|nr:TonB-dependent receptor [Gibbsiella quercinecans]
MLTSTKYQGYTKQRLMKLAVLAAAIHCACGYAATVASTGSNTQDQTTTAKKTANTDADITVTATPLPKEAGSKTTITAAQMQQEGGNDFGTIMRYQPLVTATGAAGGSGTGKSGFDRSGYTGYNIRGLEANRVSIDVDGVELPSATGRSYVSRAGTGTFGIGRDYIDPYMYGSVDIAPGATEAANANQALGGAVSFRPKSADDYLSPTKSTYFGYQSDYDSSNRSWHNGFTAAGGDETLRGLVAYSRRDGQETRNNSGTVDANPANWHSDAFLASGIWRINDAHQLTGTFDYYNKTNHTHYDAWNTAGSATIGTNEQTSKTRRWAASLEDLWTPDASWIDVIDSKIFYQSTEAHDRTYGPNSTGSSLVTTYSNYDTKTYGFETKMAKDWGIHQFRWGLNARTSKTERPFNQDPTQSSYTYIMQPEANSESYNLGAFAQDTMTWDLAGHNFSVVPAVRVAYQKTKPDDLSTLASGSLTESELQTLYGSTSDTQVLPSLSFLYDITPKLTTYIQYKRGAQFPNASQMYGSWNLSSSYAGSSQYALIGNADLKTETSNNFEWGLKGEAVEGITISTAAFYNSYKNFIDYSRYTRAANPERFTNIPSNIYIAYQAENRDKAYIYGGEISAKFNFGTWFQQVDGLSARLAYGMAEGAAKSSYLGDKYVDLESVAPMRAIVGVAYDDPSQVYGAALTATFNKGKRATATNRESYNNTGTAITDSTTEYMKVPGYGLLDFTAYYRVTKNVKVSGGVYNITDRKYWDYLSSRDIETSTNQDLNDQALAVQPGRTFQLGVNVDF